MSAAATDTRMDRPEAIEIAKAFVAEIEGTYDQLVIGGSLRRRLARIGDVEIVAVPKVEPVTIDLLAEQIVERDRLDARMQVLLDNDVVARRLDVNGSPRWGPTLKYLVYGGARVDLFTPCAERFGWILLLRTGPAAFSRQLVVERGRKTKDGRPGLLPPRLLPRDGWLTSRLSAEKIPTPTEQSVFEPFKIPYIEPWSRT
jgi:DNA polymerase/3'-5' exonuclease PolX